MSLKSRLCRLLMVMSVLCVPAGAIFGRHSKNARSLLLATATSRSSGSASRSNNKPWGTSSKLDSSSPKSYKLVQVQIVHRHGDRTPITPLKNESYWSAALPHEEILSKVSNNTKLIRDENHEPNAHLAAGRGPFGQLSQLGLLQMVDLGNRLRDELSLDEPPETDHHIDEHGNRHMHHGRLFHAKHLPLHPRHVTVKSTDFPRTIQSVQGVLVGLFPDAPDETLHIDVRHTSTLIPDPQPRRSKEQEELERRLASRPHLQKREQEMKDLAIRATEALRPLLGEDAFKVSYGIGEEGKDSETHLRPLAWTQLSEITKCLQVRNLLPESITEDDHEAISTHAAWKWMENLRHPRLAYLAMNPMVSNIMVSMRRRLDGDMGEALHIYSAHDSTLIGLLCAFRLEPPTKWPEYGSYLKIELIEVGELDSHDKDHDELEKQYFVRFSLNGEVLHSKWDPEHEDEPLEVIPLDLLMEKVATVGASPLPQ